MKKRFGPIVLLAGALFLLAAQFSIAQSVDVKGRGNALRVLGYSLFDENEGFGGTGAGLAYGIAGHLDIGFDAGMRFGEIEGEDAEESRLTFHFRGLLARQTEGFPITLSLGFDYHFALVQSDYLEDRFEDYELLRNGRGYAVSAGLMRDLNFGPAFALRTGLGVRLDVERYTTSVASGVAEDEEDPPPIELGRYPIEELDRTYSYTASLGPVIRPGSGNAVISALGTFRYDQHGEISGGAELGVSFMRRP